jgi:hypothetical protein
MEERYSTERLLSLRRVTRAMADLLRGQMKEYLSTLAPLFHPRVVLSSYVEGPAYDVSRIGEKAFKELQQLYHVIAKSRPYNLPLDFRTPLEVINPQLEMTPVEYTYVAKSKNESKTVVVTSPLKWALTYAGFGPNRLKALLTEPKRTSDELQQLVLHYLMMNTVVSKQTGLTRILDALRFPLITERFQEFGDLPLTFISSSISTIRLPDEIITESTEISGMDAVEEVVNIPDIAKLGDPLKERLTELLKSHDAERLIGSEK